MCDFKELKNAAKSFAAGDFRIAVVGDCATQFLVTAIKGACAQRGICGSVFEAEYNQVSRQMLAEDSELRRFSPDVVVIWETVERWWDGGLSAKDRLALVEKYVASFSGKVLYLNAAPFRDGVFGNYVAGGASFSAQIRAFNAGLDVLATEHANLYVVDLHSLVASVGRASSFDPPTWAVADMPLVPDVQAQLATLVVDIIAALRGQAKKCVVLDLDNTLWGGVIGEDGLAGIQIGEHGAGKAFKAFQKLLKRLKERGVLLAVCSKNDDAMAREPFEQHPDMVLRIDDIACFVANWETKADNVAHIQKVLNIGMESFVFIDDNPVEREIVRLAHPSVVVPEMPEDVAAWVDFLAGENLFETVSYSAVDANRTSQYRIEAERVAFAATFVDEQSFLKGLDMCASVAPLDEFTIPRAAQLSQRSNQFNLRTVRYAESDLCAYAKDPSVVQLGFTLSDRFGSHGLVGVIIGKIAGDEMFIDTWFMSCRVLKRGLEEYSLNKLVEIARQRGIKRLVGEYLPTKKNNMVSGFYVKMGFEELGGGRFKLELDNYNLRETTIHD